MNDKQYNKQTGESNDKHYNKWTAKNNDKYYNKWKRERVTVNTTKNGQERVIEEHYNKWTVDSAFLLQLILLDGLQPSVNSSSNNYTKFFSKTVVYGSQCVDQQYKRLRIAVVLFLT